MTRHIQIRITKLDLLRFAAERQCLSGLDGNEWSIVVEKGAQKILFVPDEVDSLEVLRLEAVHEES